MSNPYNNPYVTNSLLRIMATVTITEATEAEVTEEVTVEDTEEEAIITILTNKAMALMVKTVMAIATQHKKMPETVVLA